MAPEQNHLEAGETSYTLKFTEPLTPVDTADLAAGIKVSINGASETAVQSAEINTGDTKNVDITLASPLSWTDTISFTMEAGLLKDAANNQNKAIPAMDIDVRDTIRPALAAEQDVLVAGSDQYTIRFTEPVFEVDSSKTKAGIRFELSFAGAEKATRPVTNVIIDNDDRTQVHVTLSEAASVRPDGTTSTVRRNIESGLFRDAAGNGSSSSSYKEITVADKTPPALAARPG